MKLTVDNLTAFEKTLICNKYLFHKTIHDTAKSVKFNRAIVREVLQERGLVVKIGARNALKMNPELEDKKREAEKLIFSSVADVVKHCATQASDTHKKISGLMKPTSYFA